MPDGLLCLLAFLIAAAVATPQLTTRLQPLLMLGSVLAGLVTLNILPALPPASAADRFLCLLPLLALADCCRTTNTRRFTTLPNMLVLTAIVPTVLFRSVWLIQPASQTILGITPTGWLLLLGKALEDVQGMIGKLGEWAMASQADSREIYRVGLNTTRLLMASGDLIIGWLLVRQAEVAQADAAMLLAELTYYTALAQAEAAAGSTRLADYVACIESPETQAMRGAGGFDALGGGSCPWAARARTCRHV